jgi:hypothetical protein
MARRSILSGIREEKPNVPELEGEPAEIARPPASVKPSRRAKLHIGGYYDPTDPVVIAFQKLGIDLRMTQQLMIFEAIGDFVAKQEAQRAFGKANITRLEATPVSAQPQPFP